ncbi:DNA polymerase/3'-5' exonuclease PolX [Candidatus Sumerlaeota bacterium]|nr:DNA polymerase/3'-5' exonuclease PolX [Candidatus Sumerlaeota bacterium]
MGFNDKSIVVQQLKHLGALLELDGANVFKVNAFRNAIRTLETLEEPLDRLIEEGRLSELKGFGKSIVADVTEIANSADGACEALRELRARIPAGLMEFLRIDGFGAKKARTVWQELGVTTLEELQQACQQNRVAALKGFGPKSQENILKGIERLAQYRGRFLAVQAERQAAPILETLRKLPCVTRAEIAGSLRRKRETVKDADIIAASDDPETVMQAFIDCAKEEGQVIAHGKMKSAIRLGDQLQLDLRVVPDAQFASAAHHFTGSKEHNVAMRGRAQRMGFKINEYGLFKEEAGEEKLIACRSEEELFSALGLQYIPPELREDMGEIAAAEKGELPQLVQEADIKGILHVHSTYSDGKNSIRDMAEAAQKMGYAYIAICDHSRSAAYAKGLSIDDVERQHQEIDALNNEGLGIRILKGIESDILQDGALDYPENVLKRFEIIVASVHSRFNLSASDQTRRIVNAVKNPYCDVIGHPTGRLLLGREPYPVDIREIINAATSEGKAIELNCNPHRMDLDWREILASRDKGLKIAINTDAHSVEGLHDIHYGVGVARKGWCKADDVINACDCDTLLRWRRSAVE